MTAAVQWLGVASSGLAGCSYTCSLASRGRRWAPLRFGPHLLPRRLTIAG